MELIFYVQTRQECVAKKFHDRLISNFFMNKMSYFR